jgi:hypothetical protein
LTEALKSTSKIYSEGDLLNFRIFGAFAVLLMLVGCSVLFTVTRLEHEIANKNHAKLISSFILDLKSFTKNRDGECREFDTGAISCFYFPVEISVQKPTSNILRIKIESESGSFFPISRRKMANGKYVPADQLEARTFVVESLIDLNLISAVRSFSGTEISLNILDEICVSAQFREWAVSNDPEICDKWSLSLEQNRPHLFLI